MLCNNDGNQNNATNDDYTKYLHKSALPETVQDQRAQSIHVYASMRAGAM